MIRNRQERRLPKDVLGAMRIIFTDFYEFYFFRDYGTTRGPCIVCYAATRSSSKSSGVGLYKHFEIFGVDNHDPSKWFCYDRMDFIGTDEWPL